jgi:hydroxyacylglutathione hydrolase
MHFEQILQADLGCASYVLADAGEAIVVDPRLETAVYERVAERLGARIAHVVDTHDHADHVSGRHRLAQRTGAVAHRPATGDLGLQPGDELRAGRVVLRAVAAPGHRPEHLAFLVTDESRSSEPCLILAGDSLMVGDVARPDLAVDPRVGAEQLHATLQRLLGLGDHLEVWPAHVGGSLCGGGQLSPKTSSTVGVERRCSPNLSLAVDAFVDRMAAPGRPKPPNLARVVRLNRSGTASAPAASPLLEPAGVAGLLAEGCSVLDGRSPLAFDAAHLGGSALVPATGTGIANRAAWAVGVDEPLILVAGDEATARVMERCLHAVGLWSVRGVTVADPAAWRVAGLDVREANAIDVAGLAARIAAADLHVVDVRDEDEYAAAHVPGSTSLPLHRLGDGRRAALGLPEDRELAVVCARGPRAAIGASLIRRSGRHRVVRLTGGGVADLGALGVELAAA